MRGAQHNQNYAGLHLGAVLLLLSSTLATADLQMKTNFTLLTLCCPNSYSMLTLALRAVYLSGREEFENLRDIPNSRIRPEWAEWCQAVHDGWEVKFWDEAAALQLLVNVSVLELGTCRTKLLFEVHVAHGPARSRENPTAAPLRAPLRTWDCTPCTESKNIHTPRVVDPFPPCSTTLGSSPRGKSLIAL